MNLDTKLQKSLHELLANKNGSLQSIVNKIQYLTQVNTIIQKYLPAEMANHVTIANRTQKVLIVALDSSVWGMRFRFQIPTLLNQLKNEAELREIQSIEWYISQQASSKVNKKRNISLSLQNAKLLDETAESLSSATLKKALKRLAARAIT